MGERAVRFAPEEGAELVDVCPLCQDVALEHGWIKEGTPTTPTLGGERRRRRRRGIVELLGLTRANGDAARSRSRSRSCAGSPRRGRAARGGRPLQRERVPAHRRRDREEPRRGAGEHRPALRRGRRARGHGRLGPVLVPVPRQPRVGPAGAARAARPRARGARGLVQGLERARRGRGPPRPRDREAVEARVGLRARIAPERQLDGLARAVCRSTFTGTFRPGFRLARHARERVERRRRMPGDREDHVARPDPRLAPPGRPAATLPT